MATYTGRDLGRGLKFNGKFFQSESCTGTLTYYETVHSDNSVTLEISSLTVNYSAWTIDGAARPTYCTACCGSWNVNVGPDFGGGILQSWNIGISLPLGSRSWTRTSGKTYHVEPGGSVTIKLYAHSGPSPCGTATANFTYTNNRTKPTPRPPTISPSCYANTANGNTIVFNGGGSWGWCDTGYYSSSYAVYDNAAMTGTPIKSGSGYSATVSGLSPNTRYWATFSKNNGCYSRSGSCSAVTVTPNSLSEAAPQSFDRATVRLAVTNGGGEYAPTTDIYLKKCNSGSWQKVATSTTTSIEVVKIERLVEETCYQLQARTTTPAGTYIGNTVQFNTPKKGLCIAEFTKIEPGMNEKTYEATADICYKWETTKVPAKIVVRYQVKDGYDKTWYESEEITVNEYTGTYCLTLRNLYPNQTVYQTYIHTETDEATYDSPMSEFVTAVIPEPDIHNCENFTYMTELLCQAVKKLYHGNKTIYANPYSQAICDPYNEDPTMLTLWSRALRLFHGMYCLVCDMGGARLTASKPGQYLVGEAGWQDIIKIIDENADSENWKIATSDAIWQYLQDKLHEVWHYHGNIDVLVYELADLDKFPDATSAIITSENAIYRKVDGSWVKSTAEEDEIDDMGVWHIKLESSTQAGYVQPGSAWYQWQGVWQPMDADVIAFAKIIDAMWEKKDQAIYNEVGADRLHVDMKDRLEFDCTDYPDDERTVIFITEPLEIAPPGYHLLKFETGENATIVQNQEVMNGALPQKPTDPEKTCMDFVTWNDKATGAEFDWSLPVKADHTLVAVWQPHPVTITFDIGDKATGDTPAPINGYCGDAIGTLTTTGFTRPGGTFDHWAIDGVPIDSAYILERNSVAVAVWTMEEETVTFVLGNGEADIVKTTEYGNTVTANNRYRLRSQACNSVDCTSYKYSSYYYTAPPTPSVYINSLLYDPSSQKCVCNWSWSKPTDAGYYSETITYDVYDNEGNYYARGVTLDTATGGAAKSGTITTTGILTAVNLCVKVYVSTSAGTSNQTACAYAPVAGAAFLGFDWDELRRTCTVRATAPGARQTRVSGGYAPNVYNIGTKLTEGEFGDLVVKDLDHGAGEILYLEAMPESKDNHQYLDEVAKISIPIPNPILGVHTPSCEQIAAGKEKEYIVDIVEKKKGAGACTPRWQNGDRLVEKEKCPKIIVDFIVENGEPTPPPQELPYTGGYVTKPDDPVNDGGCDFGYWAVWEEPPEPTIKVVFYAQPDEPGGGQIVKRVAPGSLVEPPDDPTPPDGCRFYGWYKFGTDANK